MASNGSEGSGCRLCGLPIVAGRGVPAKDGGVGFCCTGCRLVWGLVQEGGAAGEGVRTSRSGPPPRAVVWAASAWQRMVRLFRV